MPEVVINRLPIRYTVTGHGAPILLIMGFGFGLEGWRPQLSALAPHHRLCAFDNRGIGPAPPPPPYTTMQLAGDALGLLDHLGWPDAHIVGLSMGGMVAQQLALRAPHRVRSLSLISTHAGGWSARPTLALIRNLLSRPRTREERLRASIALNCSPDYIERVGVEGILALLGGIDEAGQQRAGMLGQAAAVLRHDTRHRLPQLRDIPALVLAGRHDQVVRPQNARLLSEALQAREVVLEGGHALNAECAEQVNAHLLRFFSEVDAGHAARALSG